MPIDLFKKKLEKIIFLYCDGCSNKTSSLKHHTCFVHLSYFTDLALDEIKNEISDREYSDLLKWLKKC